MRTLKSEPNNLGAVIVLTVNESEQTFHLSYDYDSEDIAYGELMPMFSVQDRVNKLRKRGLVGAIR